MPRKMRGMILAAAMAFMGIGAYAETVSISTYYPSPYGSYQNLDTGGFTSTGAANLATTGGNVGIGTTTAGAKLTVASGTSYTNIGHLVESPRYAGIAFGQTSGPVTVANYSLLGDGSLTLINRATGGTIEFRENNNTQMTVASGGNVGIGMNPSANRLSVNGMLYLCQAAGGPCGVLRVACDGTNCWPVYS